MIAFSCSSCGMKFKVQDEFIGRSSKCPTCKQPLVVPPPDHTQADVAAGQIDGAASSLAKVGHDGGVTLESAAGVGAGQRSVREILSNRADKDGRYVIEREIARGGMGVVLRAVDCDIRREVAVKYLLDQSNAAKKARFIEEAQITGQLEHPNIPPIHELDVDANQRLFFSMKMVKGRSLANVLDSLRKDPRQAGKDFSVAKLLNILVSVCNAIAYAHSCGVVHRDLKPANIMVGDFGEVYVMDWGLAKVLKDGRRTQPPAPLATVVPNGSASAPLAIPAKVETSRQADIDLTQEGAVLGTPVYMPPEQAIGRGEFIDQRSDVYSLGAILYEMLTLQPPVEKQGGYFAILMRVTQGEIVPPEQRTKRAIPKELAAVAMKALAKDPQDRYPTVEALRKDIERFQEGRSVSAKQDTYREALWRLVKRNRVASAFTAVLAAVLVWSSVVNYLARRQAERATVETNQRTARAVPALVRSARLLVNEWQIDEALAQLEFAQQYDAKYAEARLVKGQIFVAQKNFGAGRKELEHYLRDRPHDADAKTLLELTVRGKPDDPVVLFALAEVFQRQKMPGLTFRLLRDFQQSYEDRKRLLQLYRKQIESSWPSLGNRLVLEQDGRFSLNFGNCKQVASLDALRGMQLHSLSLEECDRLTDLSPLRGMPLTTLNLSGCALLSDLGPLRGMPLTALMLARCGRLQDLRPLQGLPLGELNLAFCVQLSNLGPLQGLPLKTLSLNGCDQVSDLAPLRGLPLNSLDLTRCGKVQDLTPLRGLPLATLNLEGCRQLKDLSPLQRMKIQWLSIIVCTQLQDVTPLQGVGLTEIRLTPRLITKGMNVLRQMKSLKTIGIGWHPTQRFSPAEFWRKYDAGDFK